ncbi:hypothetical protein ACLMJK_007743 [Lecanora helva]
MALHGTPSLVSNAVKITARLQGIRNLPVVVVELANELSSFQQTVRAAENVPIFDAEIQGNTEIAENIIRDIDRLLGRYIDLNSQKLLLRSKIGWTMKDKDTATKLRQRLSTIASNIVLFINAQTLNEIRRHDPLTHDILIMQDVIIAVIGGAGAGKSHFIQQIIGVDDGGLGHSLHSGPWSGPSQHWLNLPASKTQGIQAYSVTVEGCVVTLIDTPGFDAFPHTGEQIVEDITSWLSKHYESHSRLSGIVYLQPITASPLQGSVTRNLDVFFKLFGPDSFHNILLVTTMWDHLRDSLEGQRREEILGKLLWKDLIDRGSTTARSAGDRASALAILKKVAFNQTVLKTAGAPLSVRKWTVDERNSLNATSTYENQWGSRTGSEIYSPSELSLLHEQRMIQMYGESYKFRERRQQVRALQGLEVTEPDVYVHFRTKDFLDIDPPPLFTGKPQQGTTELMTLICETMMFSLTPIIDFQKMLRPALTRVLRPKFQRNHSRIEWKCSCGDLLYGDFIEKTQGSLQNLAAQLRGQVIGGPAVTSYPSSASNATPSLPPPLYISDQSRTSTLVRDIGTSNGSGLESSTRGAGTEGKIRIQSAAQYQTTTPRWLELCIRSGTDTYILGELDVAGKEKDQTMFNAIREKYHVHRNANWFSKVFALRIVNGGVFVQFRIDKPTAPTGKTATASVMKYPSMPKPEEARHYKYVFDPVPMDEPPMDKRTFNHYFHKPHLADDSATWVRRFPQLSDKSLFYSQEKLAKGWGIEITEDKNWMLFIWANVFALIISGAVAGISSWLMDDNQAGVAIGTWLTAVQTLITTALFWRWTNN